jgi:hypothetical protein
VEVFPSKKVKIYSRFFHPPPIKALEAKRTGRRKTRGGSLVRAAPTLTRK